MGRFVKYILSLLFGCQCFVSFALSPGDQRSELSNWNFTFKQISQDQGLPGINLVDQLQDHNGIMWFSVESVGLARYDGHKFTLYRNEPGNPASLSSNYVNQFVEDSSGNLWISTDYGLCCLNTKTNRIDRFLNQPGDKNSLPNNVCKSVAIDSRNRVWIGTENGMALKTETGFIRYLSDSMGLDEVLSIQCIYIDKNGTFWLGTKNGLVKFNPETGEIKRWRHEETRSNTLIHNNIHVIREDRFGYLWLGTHRGLDRFNPRNEKFERWKYYNKSDQIDLEQEGIYTITIDHKGIIWVGTYTKGLVLIDLQVDDYVRITTSNKSLLSNHIRSIYEDRQGLIWIGTKFEGLFMYDDNSNLFSKWPEPYRLLFPIRNKYLISFYEDENQVYWLGTKFEGLFKVDLNKEKVVQFEHHPNEKNTLSSNRIQSVLRDRKGNLWIGTEAGLNLLNEKTGRITRHGAEPVNSLLCDKHGQLWIGTTSGLFFLREGEQQMHRFKETKADVLFNNPNLDVLNIFQDSSGALWFSTRFSGLYNYRQDKGKMLQFYKDETNHEPAVGNMPRGIAEDKNGHIWIGTKDLGLFRFDPVDSSFVNYNVSSGLPSPMILNIEPQKDGDLWLGTLNGISKFNPEKGTVVNFNSNHGLLSLIIEIGAHFTFKTGEVLFGGNNGFNIFNPEDLDLEFQSPPMIITSVKAFDEEILRDVARNQVIELKYSQNNLAFEFTLPDYKNPFKHEYSIKMEGIDPDWKMLGNRNYASYTNLLPGVYQFKVRGANDLGSWCVEPLTLTIILKPPVYKTLWFKLLVILCIILVVLLIYFQIKNRQSELERLVRERTAKLENAFDELFEKNVMINNQKAEIEAHQNQLELKVLDRTRDLEEARQKAVESDRLKSSFLANMSHEIRTPLNAITGFSTLICGDSLNSEKKEKYLGIIKSNASSLLKLVEDILDISKIEAGQLTIHKDYFDLLPLMSELNDIFIQELKSRKRKDVRLVYLPPSDMPGVLSLYSDPIRIRQVMINLLGNAVKFTHKGQIDFGFRIKEPMVEFWVRDTGIGISENEQQKIFNRFTKIEEGNAIYRGTGLGLSISKSLVELLGGKIWVESKPNEGSCFTFQIPGQFKWQAENAGQQVAPLEIIDLKHLSILIVEDERSNYELLHSFFSGCGARLTWASDGSVAVSFCEKQRYDLILMDIRMPGMDGYQTIHQIRQLWPDVPVIAQTAFAQADDLKKIEEAGFNDVLVKPFFKEDLFRKVYKQINPHF